jgi:hypothetical protein
MQIRTGQNFGPIWELSDLGARGYPIFPQKWFDHGSSVPATVMDANIGKLGLKFFLLLLYTPFGANQMELCYFLWKFMSEAVE